MDGESGETSSGRWMGKVVRHRVGEGGREGGREEGGREEGGREGVT